MTMRKRPLLGLLSSVCFAIVYAIPVGSVAQTQCTCRSVGQSYAEGTCACLDRPGSGSEIACCGKVLNNTSWTFTGKSCPIAATDPTVSTQPRVISTEPANNAPGIPIGKTAPAT